jgi:hypothetical protein
VRFLIADVLLVIALVGLYVVIRKAIDGIAAKKEARRLESENKHLEEQVDVFVQSELDRERTRKLRRLK